MFKRFPTPDQRPASGLVPAALLGLLGLPLIVEAGPSSTLPCWAYPAGLAAALTLGLTTAMRTGRIERIAALVATTLLAGLCLVQPWSSTRKEPGPETSPTRSARPASKRPEQRMKTENETTHQPEENR